MVDYPSESFEYDCLISRLKPYVAACGMTELNREPLLRVYTQCVNRMALLSDIKVHLTDILKSCEDLSDSLDDADAFDVSLYNDLKRQYGHFPLFDRAPPQSSLDTPFGRAVSRSVSSFRELFSLLELEASYVADVFFRLDKNNTIDQRPSVCVFGDLYREWNDYLDSRPAYAVNDTYMRRVLPACRDEAYELLAMATRAGRLSMYKQRVLYEMRTCLDAGWYCVFDTLTLAPDRVSEFVENPSAHRDFFRSIGRATVAQEVVEGKQGYVSPADVRGEHINQCYRYFCVPEYGSEGQRLHWHVVHLFRTLPAGCCDPNASFIGRYRREVSGLKGFWKYGFQSPIAVRHQGDSFTRDGWLWPIDKKTGKAIPSKPPLAVAYYVLKYVTKQAQQVESFKEHSQWNSQFMLDSKTFRIRMSRGFGTNLSDMSYLSLDSLVQATQLHWSVTQYPRLMKLSARRELRARLSTLTLDAILAAKPETTNQLKLLRALILGTPTCNPGSFTLSQTASLLVTDISDELLFYIEINGYAPIEPSADSSFVGAAC